MATVIRIHPPVSPKTGVVQGVSNPGQSHGSKARFERWQKLLSKPLESQEEWLRWLGCGVGP